MPSDTVEVAVEYTWKGFFRRKTLNVVTCRNPDRTLRRAENLVRRLHPYGRVEIKATQMVVSS